MSAFSDAESTSKFQSTPSARRATKDLLNIFGLEVDFNPRPPRGGRLFTVDLSIASTGISIHALREEGDIVVPNTSCQNHVFQSTPSARRATSCIHY